MSGPDVSDVFRGSFRAGVTWRERITGEALAFIEAVEAEMAKRGDGPNLRKVEARLNELIGDDGPISYSSIQRHFSRLQQ